MPIRPENRARYPADWAKVRERILQRAHFRCEWEGCNVPHLAEGYWHGDEWKRMSQGLRDAGCKVGDAIACADGSSIKLIRIILTIAHLDHTPENCADENLRAWCQRHHLGYDAKHHAVTAARTRHERANTRELFG